MGVSNASEMPMAPARWGKDLREREQRLLLLSLNCSLAHSMLRSSEMGCSVTLEKGCMFVGRAFKYGIEAPLHYQCQVNTVFSMQVMRSHHIESQLRLEALNSQGPY